MTWYLHIHIFFILLLRQHKITDELFRQRLGWWSFRRGRHRLQISDVLHGKTIREDKGRWRKTVWEGRMLTNPSGWWTSPVVAGQQRQCCGSATSLIISMKKDSLVEGTLDGVRGLLFHQRFANNVIRSTYQGKTSQTRA